MSYPVSISLTRQLQGRNRLTAAFRPVLAVPHAIVVGPVYWWARSGTVGLLGAVAYFLAIVSWFTIVFMGRQLHGIRELTLFYLRWRARAVAYMALLVDPYPPFGDAPYPLRLHVEAPPEPRDRLRVAFRVVLVIPHLVVLAFLAVAWLVVTIIAWLTIVFWATYPTVLYDFAASMLLWALRVEAYMLLLIDEYPPFALE